METNIHLFILSNWITFITFIDLVKKIFFFLVLHSSVPCSREVGIVLGGGEGVKVNLKFLSKLASSISLHPLIPSGPHAQT